MSIRFLLFICSPAFLSLLWPAIALGSTLVTISLDTHGNDAQIVDPTAAKLGPFHSFTMIQDALDSISSRPGGPPTAIRVIVGPGIFRISHPLLLNGAQLKGTSVEIVGAGRAQSRVVGSTLIGDPARAGWFTTIDRATIDRYESYSYAALRSTTPHPLLIWRGDQRIIPGTWPRQGWGYVADALRTDDGWRITLEDSANKRANLVSGQVRIEGFFGNDWAYESVPGHIVAPDIVEIPAKGLAYGVKVNQRVRLENARGKDVDDELRADYETNRIAGTTPGSYELAVAEGFARINATHDIRIRGLAFSGFTGDALRITNSSDIAITDNLFERIGDRGIFIENGKRIRIAHNRMRLMGEGGVDASGGDRASLEHSNIVIQDNDFERFSEIVMSYRPAVRIRGVGASVIHNRMHDAPHSAIIFEGNDHTIKGNDIYNVVQDVRDSGAIYTWRDWTTYGTTIEDNLFAHIRSSKTLRSNNAAADTNAVRGIYLDEYTSGIKIRDNIFYDVDYAIFVNGGSDVVADNNIFIHCNPSFALYPWGVLQPRSAFTEKNRAVAILNNLRTLKSRLFTRYPRLSEGIDKLRIPTGDEFRANTLVDSSPPTMLRNLPAYMDMSNPDGISILRADVPDPVSINDARDKIRATIAAAAKR